MSRVSPSRAVQAPKGACQERGGGLDGGGVLLRQKLKSGDMVYWDVPKTVRDLQMFRE